MLDESDDNNYPLNGPTIDEAAALRHRCLCTRLQNDVYNT
jgi:hypothetical protein